MVSSQFHRLPEESNGGDRGGSRGHVRRGSLRGSLGKISDNDGGEENIRVCLRLRPMNKLEASRRSRNCIEIHKGGTKITVDAPLEGEYDFSFDRVFDEKAPQSAVFEDAALPMAKKLLDGYNCALIAYGQTGSGKTYTMMGAGGGLGRTKEADGKEDTDGAKDTSADESGPERSNRSSSEDANRFQVELDEDAGMIPRIIQDMFRLTAESSPSIEYTIRCSYIEIYMEKILDLLNPTNRALSVVDDSSITKESDDGDCPLPECGVRIKGASEPCCFDETDVIALLARGNAYRKLSSNKMNTNSNRSHAVFIVRLEQKDCDAGTTKTSQLQLVDLAGSEMAGKVGKKNRAKRGSAVGKVASQKEAKMVNRSFTTLANVVKALSEQQQGGRDNNAALDNDMQSSVPYKKSKLTRVLREAFGGKCSTGIILTGSSSSYNISETIATIRFGQRCRRVKNTPHVKLDLSGAEYRRKLAASDKKQAELMNFVKALAGECRQLKLEGLKGKLVEASYRGPLWDSIDTILEDSDKEEGISKAASLFKTPSRRPTKTTRGSAFFSGADDDEVSTLQADLAKALSQLAEMKKETSKVEEARDRAESILGEIQSEAAVLRTQNDNLSAEKKKNMQDLIDAKNEIQILSQRKLEVEHNLRTSQFRENEATVFLRQFRRFYRRLLRNKAAQGTGDTSEITAKVPGVPDLNDLIDVDTLLLESGLIEEEELRDDATVGTYRPSSQALLRSTSAAKKAAKEAAALGKVAEAEGMSDGAMLTASSIGRTVNVAGAENLEMISELGDGGVSEMGGDDRKMDIGERLPTIASVAGGESGAGADAGAGESEGGIESLAGSVVPHSITSRGAGRSLSAMNIAEKQQALMTPSGRLTSMREKDLERDLLQMTERCIELQIALNEEKANVDVLTNRTGSLSKKRLAQEAISLRQALDRKTHDLQAIIWKMNELHLINKTYNEKMANREQHVTYLEENLVDLQNTNRRLISDRQESEKKLRDELNELKILVDAMTIPLWQFDEGGKTRRSLASRVVVPLHGGAHPDGVDWSNSPPAFGVGVDETSGSESDASISEDDGDGADMGKPSQKDLAPPSKKDRFASQAEEREEKKDQSAELGTGATASVLSASNTNGSYRNDAALNGSTSADANKTVASAQKPASDATLLGRSSPTATPSKDQSSKLSASAISAAAATAALTTDDSEASPTDMESKNDNSVPDPERSSGITGDEKVKSFAGGKAAGDQPRRFVQKASTSIKPGVLKESKKKGGGDSVLSSGSSSNPRSRSRSKRSSVARASTSRAQGQRAQVR